MFPAVRQMRPSTRTQRASSGLQLNDVLPLIAACGYGAAISAALGASREFWTCVPDELSPEDAVLVREGSSLWRSVARVTYGRLAATRLMLAAGRGRMARVEQLLAWGGAATASAVSPRTGWTPLMFACGITSWFLSPYAADGDFAERRVGAGSAQALRASRRGRLACVHALLAAGADARARDATGFTALLAAAADRNSAAVKALLEAGADVNAATDSGWTALHAAAARDGCGAIDTARALLAAGADANLRNNAGMTAFDVALTWGEEEVAEMIDMDSVIRSARETEHSAATAAL